MRVVALVLAYIGIFLLITVTHLAGLWAYPSLRTTESSSGGGSENASNAITDSSTDAARTSSSEKPPQLSGTTPEESSPIVTQTGYIVAPRCALWSVEALDLYYSPADPSAICVRPPPESPVRDGSQPTPRSAQMPLNCAVAPDSAVYCLVGGQLTADTLKTFYERGELQTPKEPREGDGVKEGAVEAPVPEHLTVSPPDTYPPPTPPAADLQQDYPVVSIAEPTVSPTPIPTPSYQEPSYAEEEEDGGYVYWYTYWY